MKTKKVIFKGINWALAGIVTMLGFAGCEKENEDGGFSFLYGIPRADYVVKGTVVDKATGKPVKGIQVRLGYYHDAYDVIPTQYEPKDHVTTGAQGKFEITAKSSDVPIYVYVEDIDGVENGLFQPETLPFDASKAEQTKKPDGSRSGEYTLTVNVELTEAEGGAEIQ